ncbi:MAG: hypothetical protein R3C19_17590 [Planctomycetaceae bacterium]
MDARPEFTMNFAVLLLLTAVVVVGAIFVGGVRRLAGRRRHDGPTGHLAHRTSPWSGIVKALCITAALCVVFLLSAGLFWVRTEMRTVEVSRHPASHESPFLSPDPFSIVPPDVPQPELPEFPATATSDTASGLANANTPLAEFPEEPAPGVAHGTEIAIETADGQIQRMTLPADLLDQLSGPDAALALESFRDSLPAGLQRAYALVPISATVSDPAGVQQVLNFKRLRSLAETVGTVWTKVSQASTDRQMEQLLAELEAPQDQPAWIDNPGHGQIVVQTKFVDAAEPVEKVLQPILCQALLDDAARSIVRDFPLDSGWSKLLQVEMSDAVVRQSIRETFARNEVLRTGEGPKPMRQTYALVEFPETVISDTSARLRSAVQINRTRALGVAIAASWLTIVLLTFAVRAGRSTSAIRRLFAVSLLGLLMLPCAGVAVGTVVAMTQGRIPPIQVQPMAYSVDSLSHH